MYTKALEVPEAPADQSRPARRVRRLRAGLPRSLCSAIYVVCRGGCVGGGSFHVQVLTMRRPYKIAFVRLCLGFRCVVIGFGVGVHRFDKEASQSALDYWRWRFFFPSLLARVLSKIVTACWSIVCVSN